MKATILGASGFIGSHLARHLEMSHNNSVMTPGRDEVFDIGSDLGCVFYCVGLTADFRKQPVNTVDAHVAYLLKVLRHTSFQSFVYLSSARVYLGAEQTTEDSEIRVRSDDCEQIYNLSKLMGESLCLNCGHDNMHVVRLSNVLGDGGSQSPCFLTSIIDMALQEGHVTLHSSLESCKDFIYIDDVVDILPRIPRGKGRKIYNVASGKNVTNLEIIECVSSVTGSTYDVIEDAPTISFPKIAIDRIAQEYGFAPQSVMDILPEVIRRTGQRLGI